MRLIADLHIHSRYSRACSQEMEVTDRQIDELVYDLYGLTQEEIKIVEKASGPR